MTAYAWAPANISYAEDSQWCQEHGHTGLLVGSVCDICDRLVTDDPAFAAILGAEHNPDGSRNRGPHFIWPHGGAAICGADVRHKTWLRSTPVATETRCRACLTRLAECGEWPGAADLLRTLND
jgi:hypothetical protein